MKRRLFIRNASMAAALYPFFNTLPSCKSKGNQQNRIFVFIQLIGGNDGLNTLIPIDKYEHIKKARPNLFIPENKILPLKGTSITGLHPSLKGIQDLYNNNLIGFVQGVGYENQNYSHFRSSDIWLTGSEATQVLYTGWMARFLDSSFHNYPEGFPNPTHTDPPAVKIGDTGTFLFQGKTMDMSIVVDPAADGLEVHGISEATNDDNTYAGKEVKSIREILVQTEQYAGVIKKAISTPFLHSKLYPEKGKNLLADQLKLAAKLINGGLQTSVYHVDLKGFDTHSAQVDPSDTTKGNHSDLLSQLSQAITCFWDDVSKMGREEDVTGMTFSEFGRRIVSNAAYGTDHGAAQPLLFFGADINAGIIGSNPQIPTNVNNTDNLVMQFDHRSIYASVLKNWMGATSNSLEKKILFGTYPQIKIFKS